MIEVYISADIGDQHYEYKVDLSDTASWAQTQEETAIGLLFDGVEQLARALNIEMPEPQPLAEDVLTRCGDTRSVPKGDGRRVVCHKPFGHADRGDIPHQSKDHGSGAFTWSDGAEVTRDYPEDDSLELARVLAKGRES